MILKRVIPILLLFFIFSTNCAKQPPQSVVDIYGNLQVKGNQILSQTGEPAVLRGMSLFWSQWMGKFYNADCIGWLANDWHCTVVRAAMATGRGGYSENPEEEWVKLSTVIDACIDQGIYVIVDWHSHRAHEHTDQAVAFFERVAKTYGRYPNVIYEIYNEPLKVSWDEKVKPYADTLVASIRKIDPDNLILVGTPTWSQDVLDPAMHPVEGTNVAYVVHFYAATHTQWLRDRVLKALEAGVPLFVTEFGTCLSNGNGAIDYPETEAWMDLMETHHLSWCKWSVADKEETSSVLKPGASVSGGWLESDLSESGVYIRSLIRQYHDGVQ